MEQGTRLDSTRMSAAQDVRDDTGPDHGLDAAVAVLLTRPDPAPAPAGDHELLQFGVRFDAAHARWRDAVAATSEPTVRHDAILTAAKASRDLTMADHEAAEAVPGFRDATRAEEHALGVAATIAELVLNMRARTVQGLAVQARCLIPSVWPAGTFREEAALGRDEDVDREAVRLLITSCCAAAGVDWTGRPVGTNALAAGPTAAKAVEPSASIDPSAILRAVERHQHAKRAFDIAAREADVVHIRKNGGDTSPAALNFLNTQRDVASRIEIRAFRELIATRPQDLHGLLTMLRHLAQHAREYGGLAGDEQEIFATLIGAVEGLRVSAIIPPAGHDLSRLSIAELETLARIARQEFEGLVAIESTTACCDRAGSTATPLGEIIELEGERFGFLIDHAVNEIARRQPTEKGDINLRLEAMVHHHLNCNGYIEPALMAEINAAWGAR